MTLLIVVFGGVNSKYKMLTSVSVESAIQEIATMCDRNQLPTLIHAMHINTIFIIAYLDIVLPGKFLIMPVWLPKYCHRRSGSSWRFSCQTLSRALDHSRPFRMSMSAHTPPKGEAT